MVCQGPRHLSSASPFACPWRGECQNPISPRPVLDERCYPLFFKMLRDRTVMFLGDSVSRQHYFGLLCDLWPAAVDLAIEENTPRWSYSCDGVVRDVPFSRFQWNTTSACIACCTFHCIFLGSARLCMTVASKSNIPSLSASEGLSVAAKWLTPRDIIIANVGVHWGPKTIANRTLVFREAYASIAAGSRPMLIWRESAPQHFAGGEYKRSAPVTGSCSPFQARTLASSAFNFRNKITSPIMTAANVSILKIFKASVPYHASHLVPGKDCTHWCLDGHPGSGVLSVWNHGLFMLIHAWFAHPMKYLNGNARKLQVSDLASAAPETLAKFTPHDAAALHRALCDAINNVYGRKPPVLKILASASGSPCNTTARLLEAWEQDNRLWVPTND